MSPNFVIKSGLGVVGAAGLATVIILAVSPTLGPKDGEDLPAIDLDRVQTGDVAPDFSPLAYSGDVLTLSDYRGDKNVVLVFYRGHWRPWCAQQLGELKALLSEEQKRTTQILAVSVDEKEEQQMMIDRISMEDGITPDFPLLSDPDHKVIDRYGLFNPDESRHRPVPHPAVLVIDLEGVVRWKFVEINHKIRASNEDVLAALAELQ